MANEISTNDIRATAKALQSAGVSSDFNVCLAMAEVALKKKGTIDRGEATAAASAAVRAERKVRRDKEVNAVDAAVAAISPEIAKLIEGASPKPEFVKKVRLDLTFSGEGWVATSSVSASGGGGGGKGRTASEQSAMDGVWRKLVANASACNLEAEKVDGSRFITKTAGFRQQRVRGDGTIHTVLEGSAKTTQSRWDNLLNLMKARARKGKLTIGIVEADMSLDNLLEVMNEYFESVGV